MTLPQNNGSQKYALIVGNGRSGSNWLLSILDASPVTHCRNEPQEIAQSPFHQLPDPFELLENSQNMATQWDQFVAWTASHLGERDHRITAPKNHVYRLSQQLGIAFFPARPKTQKVLKLLFPQWQSGEWTMPWWMGSQTRLLEAYAVLKINDLRAWFVHWLLANRPQVPIIHIIRHPGGQLNSGIARFFSKLSPEELHRERHLYTGILRLATQLDPKWAEVFGPIDSMDLMEAVAWFWRYNNEEIYRVGQGYPNYHWVVYEQLAQDFLSQAKTVYEFCQLPWGKAIEDSIVQRAKESMWGKLSTPSYRVAQEWKTQLSPEYHTLVNRVLENSLLEDFWKN